MRFSAISKGARNIKPAKFWTIDGQELRCGLRPLLAADEAGALRDASSFAAARGGQPVEGDPLYELGKAVHLVAIACTDLDDATGETMFFDGGADQILSGLDTEAIFILKEQQRALQEETNPQRGTLSPEEYVKALFECAAAEAGAELPFEFWPLRMRRNFVRSMASQFVASLAHKSVSGSASETNTPAGGG